MDYLKNRAVEWKQLLGGIKNRFNLQPFMQQFTNNGVHWFSASADLTLFLKTLTA